MIQNYRIISPVGQGGFDIECIDGTTVVFDCGSLPIRHVNTRVAEYYAYCQRCGNARPEIDYVFLSHFDRDHVNGLEILSKCFKLKNIIVPYIPRQYRVMYNFVTDYSVTYFHQLVTTSSSFNDVGIIGSNMIAGGGNNRYYSIKSLYGKWEWVYKSLFSVRQWKILKDELAENDIVLDNKNSNNTDNDFFDDDFRWTDNDENWKGEIEKITKGWENREYHSDIETIMPHGITIDEFDINSYESKIELSDEQIKKINKIIGKISGVRGRESYAKNENGLMMLSKRIEEFVSSIQYPFFRNRQYPYINNYPRVIFNHSREYSNEELSACIYTGDMNFDVKSCPTILDFLRMIAEPLLLFQIPHHASSQNSSDRYLWKFPAFLFFWHDKNLDRFNENTIKTILLAKSLFIDAENGLLCRFYKK